MSIDVRARKLLWGKSGNRCVFCRQELIVESETIDKKSIVGEECHIRSSKKTGPRYNCNYALELIDSYENLILLCCVHHKLIDDQYDTYTAEILEQMKQNHESWVASQLSEKKESLPIKIKRIKSNIPSHLKRVQSGKYLTPVLDGCCAIEYTYDDNLSREDILLSAGFLQEIQDYVDIYSELNVSSKIEAALSLDSYIESLEKAGVWVFAGRENRILAGGTVGATENFPVLIISILDSKNWEIVRIYEEK